MTTYQYLIICNATQLQCTHKGGNDLETKHLPQGKLRSIQASFVYFCLEIIAPTCLLITLLSEQFKLSNNLLYACEAKRTPVSIETVKGVTAQNHPSLTVKLIYTKCEKSSSSYVLVVDTFHEHQFSVGPLRVGLILKRPAQLLDGDVPLQVVVVRRTEVTNESKSSSQQQCMKRGEEQLSPQWLSLPV